MKIFFKILATLYVFGMPGSIVYGVITKSFVLLSYYAIFTIAMAVVFMIVMALVVIWGDI